MRASLLFLTLLVACLGPASAGVTANSSDVLELAQQRFPDGGHQTIAAALRFANLTGSGTPSSEAQPRALVVAHSLLLDDESVRPEAVAAALLIGNEATLSAIVRGVGPEVAACVRKLRQPGVLPGCAPSASSEALIQGLATDLQRVAVFAHIDALRPGRRPDKALTCIQDTREGLLPALRHTNPELAESLDEDVSHLEQRYASELSGEAVLTEFRRVDGTLDWRELPAQHKEAFTLDLFLRELVAVVNTGERQRMEQFFAGLSETDFFEHYGAFALGGPSQIVNARYLSRYLEPQFVAELMRSNVNLVLGQHVSEIARGEIKEHVFSVSLTSLGLNAAAIRAGMTALGFARRVHALKGEQKLAQLTRLQKLSGWTYVVAETLIVVYISEWRNAWLQDRKAEHRAKEGLSNSSKALFRALSEVDGELTPERLTASLDAYRLAWTSYREFLLRPVFLAEQEASAALASLAEEGKRLDDKRKVILARLSAYPGLMRMIRGDYRTLDAYAGSSIRNDEKRLEAKLEVRVADLLEERETLLRAVYAAPRRDTDYLEDASNLRWHIQHDGREGAPGDPGLNRDRVTGFALRATSRTGFKSKLAKLSGNRLQTYDDEVLLLSHAEGYLADVPELKRLVSEAIRHTRQAAELDATLAQPR